MKYRITLKDPDGVYESVKDEVRMSMPEGLDDDEHKAVFDSRMEEAWDKLRRWIQFQEYVTIEFDTDVGTAKVCEAPR